MCLVEPTISSASSSFNESVEIEVLPPPQHKISSVRFEDEDTRKRLAVSIARIVGREEWQNVWTRSNPLSAALILTEYNTVAYVEVLQKTKT
jgi:hypothetical protein